MRRIFTLLSFGLLAMSSMAQTDVTKYFLSNYGFDSDFDYDSNSTASVAQEIKEIDGWTPDLSATYTITGVYEFGFKGSFNGAVVPAAGYDGEAGGCLALSTGWNQTFNYYQTVTLPAGTYTLKVPTYNGSSLTAATSTVAWIPTSGTKVTSSVTSYPTMSWTLDQITFTLDAMTTGKIQIGMVATSGGSANSAKLCIDYVQLLVENMAVDKSSLQAAITSANDYYGAGNGNGAAALKSAIDAAQAVADDSSVDMVSVLEATIALNEAIETYRKQNVSEDNPLDCTSYIVNASFEDGTNGWTVSDLASQTNNSFTKKAGATYLEKWTASGSVGNGSVKQTITNLPNGKYILTVGAQNYSQASTSKKNTGAYIYAGDQQTTVYTPDDYSVKFTCISGQVEIGYVAEGATGNWIAVDNFRLYLIGEMTDAALIEELTRKVGVASALQSSMMSSVAASALQNAIDAANNVISGTNEYSSSVSLALDVAVEQAESSIAEYAALQTVITASEAEYDASKNEAEEFLAAIAQAKSLVADSSASSEDLAAGVTALEKATLAFHIANATAGTGVAPNVTVTNSYALTGATEALIRATTTGSNILERGVCWSTEHNPTVLDERTTKNFNLNGYIFHIKDLEPATVYYVRPYVMNKTYTVAYGDEIKIITHPYGTCTWSWDGGAPTDDANDRCSTAMEQTIEYFNQWTGVNGFYLSGHYGVSTPTADCSYGGWMRIGPNSSYQAIGTVLHETGHGVGVGTHWRWYSCSDTRANVTYGKWLGREANKVLHFLENNYNESMYLTGDGVHGWGQNASYDWFVNGADKDKHYELQYIGGCCLLYGLFIDGLCPTSSYSNGISGYTYNFDSDKKYYLMSKDTDRGLGTSLVYQRTNSALAWRPMLTNEEISDSAAWYIEYEPTKGYYMFRNAMSGRYLSHAAGTSAVTATSLASGKSPSANEYFQLMPDRTDVTVGVGTNTVKTNGYWFTWADGSTDKAMTSGAIVSIWGYGTMSSTTFNYSDTATKQQWIIISEDELEAYQNAAVATGIADISVDDTNLNGDANVVGIYTVGGTKLQSTQKGMNIILYSDGTSKKIFVE